jgi:hypothetical protein
MGDSESTAGNGGKADETNKTSDTDKTLGFMPVLVAIVTAIGTLGWIAFIGAAISWIGFLKAGIPQAEAVAKIPKGVLVATGAEFVVAAIIAALITIGILYFVDSPLHRRDTSRRLKRTADLHDELREKEAVRDEINARLNVLQVQATRGNRTPSDVEKAAIATTFVELGEAELEFAKAAEAVASTRTERSIASMRRTSLPWLLLLFTSLAAASLVHVGYGSYLSTGAWVCVAGIAIFASTIGAVVFRQSGRFPTMGLVALIVVPFVMGAATYFRAGERPKVEPVAFLNANGTPFVGFFVAETSDRLFVGTFDKPAAPCLPRGDCGAAPTPGTVPAQLLSVPLADVRDLTIGPPRPLEAKNALTDAKTIDQEKPRSAREWAGETALLLCSAAADARTKAEDEAAAAQELLSKQAAGTQAQAEAPATPPESLPKTCSRSEKTDLETFLANERRLFPEPD